MPDILAARRGLVTVVEPSWGRRASGTAARSGALSCSAAAMQAPRSDVNPCFFSTASATRSVCRSSMLNVRHEPFGSVSARISAMLSTIPRTSSRAHRHPARSKNEAALASSGAGATCRRRRSRRSAARLCTGQRGRGRACSRAVVLPCEGEEPHWSAAEWIGASRSGGGRGVQAAPRSRLPQLGLSEAPPRPIDLCDHAIHKATG